MKLLADHKMTQVDMQAIMSGVSEIVKHHADCKVNEAITNLKGNNCRHH